MTSNDHQQEHFSFVVPIFNEQECIEELVKRLDGTLKQVAEVHNMITQVIFVDDGSSDNSVEMLHAAAKVHPWVVIVKLSRNFGHQIAVTAGLNICDSDYICIIDGDLQDPPELVVDMITRAKEGFNVVYGKRIQREGETGFKKLTAFAFYRVLRSMTKVDIPADTGDFRLIDKKVLEALKALPEHNRFLRGMIPWLGYRSTAFMYNRDVRHGGETKYTFRKMIRLAANAIFSFSARPLELTVLLGLSMTGLSFAGLIIMLMLWLFTERVVPGLMIMLSTTILMNGLVLTVVGVIGAYIGRIYTEVQGRPLYLVDYIEHGSVEQDR